MLYEKSLRGPFHKYGEIFRAEVVGQASCLSFLDRRAGCLSHQYSGLESSLIVSSWGTRDPNGDRSRSFEHPLRRALPGILLTESR